MAIALVAGCTKAVNRFSIDDPDRAIASAEINLCRTKEQFIRVNNQLTGHVKAICEGEGDIIVELRNGGKAMCHIGYVTNGASQDLHFFMDQGKCQLRSLDGVR